MDKIILSEREFFKLLEAVRNPPKQCIEGVKKLKEEVDKIRNDLGDSNRLKEEALEILENLEDKGE